MFEEIKSTLMDDLIGEGVYQALKTYREEWEDDMDEPELPKDFTLDTDKLGISKRQSPNFSVDLTKIKTDPSQFRK
jgi:hypothetical protein